MLLYKKSTTNSVVPKAKECDTMSENKKKQKIEIVKGKGNLDISPVSTHLDVEKPKNKADKSKIIIPKEKK